MFDSDEKVTLLISTVIFLVLCLAFAGSVHWKVEPLSKLLTVAIVIMWFALMSFSSEVVEELDRAKWFWCPFVLVLPFFFPFVLLFLPESEDGPMGIGWLLEKFGIDMDWDEDGATLLGGFFALAIILMVIGWGLVSYGGLSIAKAILAIVVFVVLLSLVAYFYAGSDSPEASPLSGSISNNPNWRCPKCSTILVKGNIDLMRSFANAAVAGVATCGNCGRSLVSEKSIQDNMTRDSIPLPSLSTCRLECHVLGSLKGIRARRLS